MRFKTAAIAILCAVFSMPHYARARGDDTEAVAIFLCVCRCESETIVRRRNGEEVRLKFLLCDPLNPLNCDYEYADWTDSAEWCLTYRPGPILDNRMRLGGECFGRHPGSGAIIRGTFVGCTVN